MLGITAAGALAALVAALARKGRSEDRARAYLAGFTYVLSDDPDAAIAELSRAAQLRTETLETYFALGALFRRKGDLERAIRLHQNILLRPGLGPEVRRRALLALAQDYRRSGMRGRAEEELTRVLQEDPDHREALVELRAVCEDAGDWARAAEIQARLVARGGGAGTDVLAHLLAAHARANVGDDGEEALASARRAVELRPESADAQLALGEVLTSAGDAEGAVTPLERAMFLEPELAPRVAQLLGAGLGDADAARLFGARAGGEGDEAAPFALALARWHEARGERHEALAVLRRALERHPGFWEARREVGALLIAHGRAEDLRAEYREILAALGAPALVFTCRACRVRLPEFTFRCPSCETWDSVRRGPAIRADAPPPRI